MPPKFRLKTSLAAYYYHHLLRQQTYTQLAPFRGKKYLSSAVRIISPVALQEFITTIFPL